MAGTKQSVTSGSAKGSTLTDVADSHEWFVDELLNDVGAAHDSDSDSDGEGSVAASEGTKYGLQHLGFCGWVDCGV